MAVALPIVMLLRMASLDDEFHAQEADRLRGLLEEDPLHGRVPKDLAALKHSRLRGR